MEGRLQTRAGIKEGRSSLKIEVDKKRLLEYVSSKRTPEIEWREQMISKCEFGRLS